MNAFYQQQQMDFRQRQQAPLLPFQPGKSAPTQQQVQQQQVQQQQVQQQQVQHQTQFRPAKTREQARRLYGPEPELTIVEEQSPPASPPTVPGSPEPLGDESGEEEREAETKFDVKEVMVTERQKRKKAPVDLEIDELSIAL